MEYNEHTHNRWLAEFIAGHADEILRYARLAAGRTTELTPRYWGKVFESIAEICYSLGIDVS